MPFINSYLNKQAQALEVTFSRTAKSTENNYFYHHILVRNAQMYIRLENLVC